ncbi:MAG: DUF362 domain-containing protein [Thermoplasmatota archaeon]
MKMPWIDENDCIGCEICVDECPVDTIYMEDDKAVVDMDGCIHCGLCHGACPEDAVKHDSEKIPEEIKMNVEETKEYMNACAEHLGDEKEADKCLHRMIKHFNKEKTVIEKTLKELNAMQNQ